MTSMINNTMTGDNIFFMASSFQLLMVIDTVYPLMFRVLLMVFLMMALSIAV